MTPAQRWEKEAQEIVLSRLRFHDRTIIKDIIHNSKHCFSCRAENQLIDLISAALSLADRDGFERGVREAAGEVGYGHDKESILRLLERKEC